MPSIEIFDEWGSTICVETRKVSWVLHLFITKYIRVSIKMACRKVFKASNLIKSRLNGHAEEKEEKEKEMSPH